jgi:hypothetical protein
VSKNAARSRTSDGLIGYRKAGAEGAATAEVGAADEPMADADAGGSDAGGAGVDAAAAVVIV